MTTAQCRAPWLIGLHADEALARGSGIGTLEVDATSADGPRRRLALPNGAPHNAGPCRRRCAMRALRGSAVSPALLLAAVACLLAPHAEAYTDPQEGATALVCASGAPYALPSCSPQAVWPPRRAGGARSGLPAGQLDLPQQQPRRMRSLRQEQRRRRQLGLPGAHALWISRHACAFADQCAIHSATRQNGGGGWEHIAVRALHYGYRGSLAPC